MKPLEPTLPRAAARIVILGGNGFVGRSLGRCLSASGRRWIGIGRDQIDLTADSADALAGLLHDDDALVFLSVIANRAEPVERILDRNVRMAENVSLALKKRRPLHVTYVSSEAVYPLLPLGAGPRIVESLPLDPPDAYGRMHMTREKMLEMAAGPIPLAVLRPVMLLGRDDPHQAYGPNRFVRQALAHEPVTLFGEGNDLRDYLSVDDFSRVVAGVIACTGHGVLNAASGHPITALEAAHRVFNVLGIPANIVHAPRTQPVGARSYDTSLLKRVLPHIAIPDAGGAVDRLTHAMRDAA